MKSSTTVDTSASTAVEFVVCGRRPDMSELGYLHLGGYFVGSDDARKFSLDDALEAAHQLRRSLGVDAATVKVVPIIDGVIDMSQAQTPTSIDFDASLEGLARELKTLDATQLAEVLSALDEDAIRALRAAGIRMSGVRAASPPQHAAGNLTG